MPKVNKGGAAQNATSVSADSEQTMTPDTAQATKGQQGKRPRKATTPAQAAPQSAADAVNSDQNSKPSKKNTGTKRVPAAPEQEIAAEVATPEAEPLLTVAAAVEPLRVELPSAEPAQAAPARAKRGRKVPAEAVTEVQAEPAPQAEPEQAEIQAEAPTTAPQPKAPASRRGRKAAVNPAPTEAAPAEAEAVSIGEEATATSPLSEAALPEVAPITASTEPEPVESELAPAEAATSGLAPELVSPAPAAKAKRGGRKASAPAAEAAQAQTAEAQAIQTEPAPEEVPAEIPAEIPTEPVPVEPVAVQPAASKSVPAKRPRKAKADAPALVLTSSTADSNTVETAVLELAEAVSPTPTDNATPAPVEAEPVLLEVPIKGTGKPRRGRKAAAVVADAPAEPLPLTEVLSGVEAVPVEVPAEAAQEPEVAEPAAQLAPQKATRPKGKGRGKQTGAAPSEPAVAEQPAQVESEETEAESRSAETQADATDSAETDSGEENQNPARDIVIAQLRKLGRPVHVRDLERTFTRQTISRIGDWRSLEALLDTLTESGEVVRTRRHTYGLPEAMSLVRGRFQASAAGFGFVVPDSGGEDYYVAEGNTMEAWNGDIVLVRMEGRGGSSNGYGNGNSGPRRGQRGDGSPRASVVRIVQRAYKQLVGTLEFHHGHPILKPDDHRARHRILVLPEGLEGLEQGARVVTELYWPEHTGEDEVFGQIKRVLGNEDDPETETEAVIVKFGLRGEFAPEAEAQANAIPAEIPAEALAGRLDLRSYNIFTVDGRDAKDFDDAIHIQPTPEGTFVVGVHIADVSHYVPEGTPLDEEAYARATSVYLPGRVLPMLPEHLSNGVCSLVPYQDRLTMTALVELSAEGDILKVQLAPSVINSKARLTYDEVQAYSEATATLPEAARQLEGDLHLLLKITTKLRQRRLREGSLDFKMREVKVDVGPDGRMELTPIREETARGMIEDLMLLANKVVAHYLLEREIPTLFRIHEEPTLQRFQDVTAAIGRLGFSFPGGEPTPQAYQAVLKQVRGTPRESVVNTLLLRSMQQAKYAGENLGHFGLAFAEYLHFTSPIRRYPDLMVHRALRGVLNGELKAGSRAVGQLQAKLPDMGNHTSARERTASEAERDLTKYYQAKWAQEHLGQTFAGNVSGVVASGLFIALENGVEGKLHISNLDDDYYVFIEDAGMLRGRSRGRSYRLGDAVNVTISSVNPLARQTDFTLQSSTPDTQENDMDSEHKPRARRRDDREQERREKLQSVPTSAPRKFTLDDPAPVPAASSAPARPSGRGRYERGERSEGSTFGGQPMNGPRTGGRPAATSGSQGGRPRRVITLERPRNEHLRPVNITVQRMYFGDWTLDHMPPEESQGGRSSGGRSFERNDRAGSERGGRGYTRGGNDRGAVQRVNGRQQSTPRPQQAAASQAAAPAQATAVQQSAGQTAQAQAAQADEAKRRRRRRGRRGGNGGPASG
ncbi:ribonuclease R [Deinococcus aquatilis]|uniref:ribonuclease R n=1 Tax=Deinococcus aquatilis TaxID=519440 RepID=UPI00037B868C|nr:ribonuclease R [Deinococcus aquatilis]